MAPSDDFVELYLGEVRSTSVVLEDERSVLRRARDGDPNARRELIRSYLAVTAELGLRLAPPVVSRLEAIQEANVVLLRLVADGVTSPAVALGPAIQARFEGHA